MYDCTLSLKAKLKLYYARTWIVSTRLVLCISQIIGNITRMNTELSVSIIKTPWYDARIKQFLLIIISTIVCIY